ncbi:MAG: hypothetical protein K0U98_28410 [Deltaproteobacteria bacterium]|nr:hypothetical protein [Deltaproteobacteria bacterium]
MNLQTALANWDGKSAGEIRSIHDRHRGEPGYPSLLIALMAVEAFRTGATWLLKALLEGGAEISPGEIETIYDQLPELDHWEQKLHLLQCMEYLPIPDAQKRSVRRFLRESLESENKFVRAWAHNGYYHLAKQYPEFQGEAEGLFAKALRDEAPSVKARIRKVILKGF